MVIKSYPIFPIWGEKGATVLTFWKIKMEYKITVRKMKYARAHGARSDKIL